MWPSVDEKTACMTAFPSTLQLCAVIMDALSQMTASGVKRSYISQIILSYFILNPRT